MRAEFDWSKKGLISRENVIKHLLLSNLIRNCKIDTNITLRKKNTLTLPKMNYNVNSMTVVWVLFLRYLACGFTPSSDLQAVTPGSSHVYTFILYWAISIDVKPTIKSFWWLRGGLIYIPFSICHAYSDVRRRFSALGCFLRRFCGCFITADGIGISVKLQLINLLLRLCAWRWTQN
jgi:hypothetical protein